MTEALDALLAEIRACRICAAALPHPPRPVLRVSESAAILICGQAPGVRVHETGIPFNDPSGDRLRHWMGVDRDTFYDAARIAIVPMGFCFPGQDASGADRPPRPECAKTWRAAVLAHLPNVRLTLLVGQYAQGYHLGARAGSLTGTVRAWRDFLPRVIPLPHPSWRNNTWLKKNPWFEVEVVPALKQSVRNVLVDPD